MIFKINEKEKLRLSELDVSIVYLFGSFAEGKNSLLSDLDLGVVFKDERSLKSEFNKTYNEVYDILTEIFPNQNIDIVFLQKSGLEICFDVISHGKVVFEFSKDERFKFEERITLLYADYKPVLNQFNATILDRIGNGKREN